MGYTTIWNYSSEDVTKMITKQMKDYGFIGVNMKMKYVLEEESLRFVLIPLHMKHSDIQGHWTSAGFVNIYQEDEKPEMSVYCYGKSESLGLKISERDSMIIQNAIKEGIY